MQIVIDISKDDLDAIKYLKAKGWASRHELLILNGTPLDEVLDKIRAEIENHCGLLKENHCKYCSYCNCVMGVREILEIFDKYKKEE